MKPTKNIKAPALIAMSLLPLLSMAQEEGAAQTTSYFSNALFNSLLVMIIVLLGVIAVMANVVKNVLKNDTFVKQFRERQKKSLNANGLIVIFFLLSASAFAGNDTKSNDWSIGGMEPYLFVLMTGVIVIELLIIYYLSTLVKSIVRSDAVEGKAAQGIPVAKEKTLIDKLNASVDIEEEASIMMEHDYDGIRELDNDLPPWWKYGFYVTIVVALIYMVNYHISKTGDLQDVEYAKEVAAGKQKVEEYMKKSANNVDETTVKYMESAADLEAGKSVFTANCIACHGKIGEGGVGPNLTDAYWLHSGSISDIFKSIKYGWADKGMKSWKEDLSPIQIAQVTSYIKSLAGSNPPNGKPAQGDLYNENGAVPASNSGSDSLKVKTDSLGVASIKVDSAKVSK